jgi:hypothetical protein
MRLHGAVRLFAVLIMLLIPSVSTQAREITAKDMLAWCTSPDGSDTALACTSYMSGFIHALSVEATMSKPAGICLPPKFTPAEAQDIFVRTLHTYPKMKNGLLETALWAALAHQFPCP